MLRGRTIAVVCGGQGSQSAGLGGFSKLLNEFPYVLDNLKNVEKTLGQEGFVDRILSLVESDEQELRKTKNTQPALFLHSCVVGSIMERENILSFSKEHTNESTPVTCVLGHSLGEYAALKLSGALDFSSGLRLVSTRGNSMNKIVDEMQQDFIMSALIPNPKVSDSLNALNSLCFNVSQEYNGVCQVANINSANQIVVSGDASTVNHLIELGKSSEYSLIRKAIPLKVGAPFHCPLMEPAKKDIQSVLEDTSFFDFKVPFVSTITAKQVLSPNDIGEILVDHCTSPVRWKDSIHYIKKEFNIDTIVEFGLGKTLSSLSKQIEPDLDTISLGTYDEIITFLENNKE